MKETVQQLVHSKLRDKNHEIARLQHEKEATIAHIQAEHGTVLAQLQREHHEQLAQLQREHQREHHAQTLPEQRDEARRELEALREQVRVLLAQKMEKDHDRLVAVESEKLDREVWFADREALASALEKTEIDLAVERQKVAELSPDEDAEHDKLITIESGRLDREALRVALRDRKMLEEVREELKRVRGELEEHQEEGRTRRELEARPQGPLKLQLGASEAATAASGDVPEHRSEVAHLQAELKKLQKHNAYLEHQHAAPLRKKDEEIAGLHEIIENLRNQLSHPAPAKAVPAAQRKELETLRNDKKRSQTELETLRNDKKRNETELETLRKNRQENQTELDSLRTKLATLQVEQELEQERKVRDERIIERKMREERERAERERGEKETEGRKVQAEVRRWEDLKNLEEEKQRLERDLRTMREGFEGKLRLEKEGLVAAQREELAQVHTELERRGQQNRVLTKELDSMKSNLDALQTEVGNLQGRLRVVTAAYTELKRQQRGAAGEVGAVEVVPPALLTTVETEEPTSEAKEEGSKSPLVPLVVPLLHDNIYTIAEEFSDEHDHESAGDRLSDLGGSFGGLEEHHRRDPRATFPSFGSIAGSSGLLPVDPVVVTSTDSWDPNPPTASSTRTSAAVPQNEDPRRTYPAFGSVPPAEKAHVSVVSQSSREDPRLTYPAFGSVPPAERDHTASPEQTQTHGPSHHGEDPRRTYPAFGSVTEDASRAQGGSSPVSPTAANGGVTKESEPGSDFNTGDEGERDPARPASPASSPIPPSSSPIAPARNSSSHSVSAPRDPLSLTPLIIDHARQAAAGQIFAPPADLPRQGRSSRPASASSGPSTSDFETPGRSTFYSTAREEPRFVSAREEPSIVQKHGSSESQKMDRPAKGTPHAEGAAPVSTKDAEIARLQEVIQNLKSSVTAVAEHQPSGTTGVEPKGASAVEAGANSRSEDLAKVSETPSKTPTARTAEVTAVTSAVRAVGVLRANAKAKGLLSSKAKSSPERGRTPPTTIGKSAVAKIQVVSTKTAAKTTLSLKSATTAMVAGVRLSKAAATVAKTSAAAKRRSTSSDVSDQAASTKSAIRRSKSVSVPSTRAGAPVADTSNGVVQSEENVLPAVPGGPASEDATAHHEHGPKTPEVTRLQHELKEMQRHNAYLKQHAEPLRKKDLEIAALHEIIDNLRKQHPAHLVVPKAAHHSPRSPPSPRLQHRSPRTPEKTSTPRGHQAGRSTSPRNDSTIAEFLCKLESLEQTTLSTKNRVDQIAKEVAEVHGAVSSSREASRSRGSSRETREAGTGAGVGTGSAHSTGSGRSGELSPPDGRVDSSGVAGVDLNVDVENDEDDLRELEAASERLEKKVRYINLNKEKWFLDEVKKANPRLVREGFAFEGSAWDGLDEFGEGW